MNSTNFTHFKFVIETDRYSGNFSRELCVYITGQIGECEVGAEYTAEFKDSFGAEIYGMFEDAIMMALDDGGCLTPVGGTCLGDINSLEIYFRTVPTPDMMDIMTQRLGVYCDTNHIGVLSQHLYEVSTVINTTEVLLEE